ncbi:hypothetical protein [Arthrobacter sp. JCM 19049]|uniref:hypothetical protein n=1 Tax=Arthrobacter sp. JCM 19049 TaxID=1460643 RepID=UPI002436D9BD|nr:hypothetical protein [Arthrobacter sp. JCM 19049]
MVATVIGFAARFTSEKLRTPQLVIASPGVYFLLPGLMIFRSMYGIVLETDAWTRRWWRCSTPLPSCSRSPAASCSATRSAVR